MLKIGDEFVIHCHQSVHVNICEDDKGFGWETGDLDSAHTHKGDHRIHWHPGGPVAEPAELMNLNRLFSDIDIELTENSVEDPSTGEIYVVGEDACGTGTGGILKAFSTPEDGGERTEITFTELLEDEARIDIEYR